MATTYTSYYQSKLPVLTMSDFEEFVAKMYHGVSKDSVDFVKHHLWLGYQCCRGQFDEVLEFLKACDEPRRKRYLTERSGEFWNGNLLHLILYWNAGLETFNMYVALREMGATLIENMYQNYPWENHTIFWTAPTLRESYGNRDYHEFTRLYYEVEQWEIKKIEMSDM